MDIEFDFKGDPIGGVISNCEYNYKAETMECPYNSSQEIVHPKSVII